MYRVGPKYSGQTLRFYKKLIVNSEHKRVFYKYEKSFFKKLESSKIDYFIHFYKYHEKYMFFNKKY